MMDLPPLHKFGAQRSDKARQSVAGMNPNKRPLSANANTFDLKTSEDSANAPTSFASVQLPPVDTTSFVSNRHEVNPAIALNLLNDIQTAIAQWQAQQRQVISMMRALHAQGPMVDGWLQSSLPSQTSQFDNSSAGDRMNELNHASRSGLVSDATILRHGDADALMKYVEALESDRSFVSNAVSSPNAVSSSNLDEKIAIDEMPVAGRPATRQSSYWLCSLNDDGSVCSQLCPPEQMAVVGSAITRFQKFKQLKFQQQALEDKLQEAVDMLTGFRNHICK